MTDEQPSVGELQADLERLSRGSVLVLGDATLERRVGGALDGVAFRLGREEAEGGGAAALAGELARLGVATALISVLGDDLAGAELTALIGAQSNVEPWLLVDGVKSTVTETRYVEPDGRVRFRTMREDVRPMNGKLRERMLRIAGDAMAATSLTVLTERGHGTLDVEATTSVLTRSRQAGRRIVADLESTEGCEERYAGFDVIMRVAESGDAAGRAREAGALRARAETGAAVLVLPEGGAMLADRDGMLEAGFPPRQAGYPAFAAAFAGALAIGRTARRALLVGALATRREGPPGMTP